MRQEWSFFDLFIHPTLDPLLIEALIPYLDEVETASYDAIREREYIHIRLDELEKLSWQHQQKLQEYGLRLDKLEELISPQIPPIALSPTPSNETAQKLEEADSYIPISIPVKRNHNMVVKLPNPPLLKYVSL